MNITKFGHACLLIEVNETRILIDPGNYSQGQNGVTNIDTVLITHEHLDHVDPLSLRLILKHNPKASIVTNSSVRSLLEREGVAASIVVVEDGQSHRINGVALEGIGRDHAIFHSSIPCIQNTGYMIAGRFFYPGDAWVDPKRAVEILALPVAAPWMKIPEAIDYALTLKPKVCFPVHDAILKNPGMSHKFPPVVLEKAGIPFTILELEKKYEF